MTLITSTRPSRSQPVEIISTFFVETSTVSLKSEKTDAATPPTESKTASNTCSKPEISTTASMQESAFTKITPAVSRKEPSTNRTETEPSSTRNQIGRASCREREKR